MACCRFARGLGHFAAFQRSRDGGSGQSRGKLVGAFGHCGSQRRARPAARRGRGRQSGSVARSIGERLLFRACRDADVLAGACGPHGVFGVAGLVPSGLFGAARKIGGRCDAARHRARHIVLPAIVLSFVGVANIALHTREKLVDILESDYVKFARARGLSTWQIVRRHGMRNLLLPAMTRQFASISEIFGGSVLVEQVFRIPAWGQAAITAGLGGDAPLLAGIAVVSAMLVFGGNLMANILYGVVDPRIRWGQMRERAGRPRIAREVRDPARAEEAPRAYAGDGRCGCRPGAERWRPAERASLWWRRRRARFANRCSWAHCCMRLADEAPIASRRLPSSWWPPFCSCSWLSRV